MKKTQICSLILLFLLFAFATSCKHLQTYTVEEINDKDILKYPPPSPVHADSKSFNVKEINHVEKITVNSKHLRNLSITIENTGNGLIKGPYLYGQHGWDVRGDSNAFASLAANITQGNLTK